MTDKLSLYNDALQLVGERKLSGLTENREPRHLLDQVYDNGGIEFCLEQGQWHFAMRTIRIDYDPAVDPEFGYQYAFDKPTDWVLTSAFCADEWFRVPITQYTDENDYWFAEETIVYVKYVSNDAAYGGDLSLWPMSFKEYVAAYFAGKIVMKVSGDEGKVVFLHGSNKTNDDGYIADTLDTAKSKAAWALPTVFPARGVWNNSRQRQRSQERGNRSGPLIG